MHPEQKAFENAIDENPLESTVHLVYADWLDEHGQPDEAAFRRSMGEWITTGQHPISDHFWFDDQTFPSYVLRSIDFPPEGRNDPSFIIKSLPKGVGSDPSERKEWNGLDYWADPDELPHENRGIDTWDDRLHFIGSTHQKAWRNLEDVLRRSFMANLQRERSQKMQRRVAAKRYSRKK